MKYSITIIAFIFSISLFGQSNFEAVFATPKTVVMSSKKIFANQVEKSQAVISVYVPEGVSRLYFSCAFLPPTVGMGKYPPLTEKLENLGQKDMNTINTLMRQFGMPKANKVKFKVLKGIDTEEVGMLNRKNCSLLNLEKTTSFTNYVDVEAGETIYFVAENLERMKKTKMIFEAVTWRN